MQQIESARSEWRKQQQLHLEESWTSLNLFDRSQKGRISMDLQSESSPTLKIKLQVERLCFMLYKSYTLFLFNMILWVIFLCQVF